MDDVDSESSGQARTSRFQTFGALRNQDFRLLWVSGAFVSAGNQVQQIAMGFLVYDLTNSSIWLGAVLGIRALPILLVGPLAGIAIDRLDRKTLYLTAQLGLVVIAFLFGLDVHFGTVTVIHALVFSFLLGLDASLNNPVRQAMIVNTVPPQDLTNAIALNNSANGVMQSIAPLLSATMIALLGVAGNFFIQGAAYVAVFLIILPIRTPYREGTAERTTIRRNFTEGIAYIRSDSTLMLLILLVFVPSLFIHSMQNQLALFAGDVFDGDALTLGYLGAAIGVGSLVATFTVASLGNFRSRGMLNMGSIILVTITLFIFGLSSKLALSLIILGFLGFFNTGFRLANNALVQSRVPDALRGRVTSIYAMDHGFQPVGSLVLGFLASSQVLGPQRAVALAGLIAIAVTVFIGLRFRSLWRLH
ncbi:MAG: MFS transporter [Chloroflexi bacterium]|nr:MFS transporter [Chloroflexota bacterium]